MQVGFSKQITESLVEEFFSIIILNLYKRKTIKTTTHKQTQNQTQKQKGKK